MRAALVLLACAGACAGPRAALRAGELPPAWKPISLADTSLAFHHVDGGAIAASVACDGGDEDAPLTVLVNHALLEVEAVAEQERRQIVVDGRAALRVRLTARLDGVALGLDLVVLKKDGCVVDAHLVGTVSGVGTRRVDFDRFVAGLSVSRRRK